VAVRSNRVVGIFPSVIDFVGDGLADAELLADFREQAIVYFFAARADAVAPCHP